MNECNMRHLRTSRETKRKAAQKEARQKAVAHMVIFLFELLAGITVGALAASDLVPLAYKERGYTAFGGEWLVIFGVAFTGFYIFHRWIFGKIQEEG